MEDLTPKKIVQFLDKYIIGQQKAKKAVAIALRNRARRKKIAGDLQKEISPKNIIMIGNTGVGKTEIARRISHLTEAPFMKVEATKFTEIGYVGRDVESIIRDLLTVAINNEKKKKFQQVEKEVGVVVEDRILSCLVPVPADNSMSDSDKENNFKNTVEKFRKKLRKGELEEKEIQIKVKKAMPNSLGGVMNINNPQMDDLKDIGNVFKNIFDSLPNSKAIKNLKIKDARKVLQEEIQEELINQDEIIAKAIEKTENFSIVFLDEIDKIVSKPDYKGAEVSREGVQRDILPLVEGCTVNTKYGSIKTDHILFIAAGAFHISSPADIIPELQGRFPIRVELESLTQKDLETILVEPKNSLIKQYTALLETEGVNLTFNKAAIKEIAKIAFDVNNRNKNLGARRLSTVMEKLLEEILFEAPQVTSKITINDSYVKEKLDNLSVDEKLSKYIL